MNHYLTADRHLGHPKVLEFEPDRKGFKATIKHNHIINENDILYNLGDTGFNAEGKRLIEEDNANCKGKSILVLGNHDTRSVSWYYDRGFDFVCRRFSIKLYGKQIVFTHYPVDVPDGVLNIHGHFHRFNHTLEEYKEVYPFYDLKSHILITTENDCKPVNLKTVIEKYNREYQ